MSDILAELGEKRGDRLLVGFAAETENVLEYARRKLEEKNCDMIVANRVGGEGAGSTRIRMKCCWCCGAGKLWRCRALRSARLRIGFWADDSAAREVSRQ